jgi:hypothetical protein
MKLCIAQASYILKTIFGADRGLLPCKIKEIHQVFSTKYGQAAQVWYNKAVDSRIVERLQFKTFQNCNLKE